MARVTRQYEGAFYFYSEYPCRELLVPVSMAPPL